MQPPAGPRVAVIVPCCNSAPYVVETIRSVAAQTMANWELILVDDVSSDNTVAVVRSEIAELDSVAPLRQVRLHLNDVNGGLASTRNVAIAMTTAEFVVPLDADDLLAPTALQRCLEVFDDADAAASALDVVHFDRREFGSVNRVCATNPFDLDRIRVFNQLAYCAMIRRSSLLAVGGYRPAVSGFDDWDLWIRATASGWQATHVAEPLLLHRRRPGSQMEDALDRYEELFARIMIHSPNCYTKRQIAEATTMIESGTAGPFLRASAFVFRRSLGTTYAHK